jgi:hypothetical protein
MQTTFIVRGMPESMLDSALALDTREAYAKLHKWAYGDLKHLVSVKYGNGAFRDRVDWNGIVKSDRALAVKCEPRRGYRLITFSPSK